MKYLLFIGDGMADYPLEKLGGKTPLQAADTPNMDKLAKKGRCGRFITIPAGMPAGSEVANLSILGYNPRVCFQGRGALEAASIGVELGSEDVAFRCNIICVRNNKIKSHSGGYITTKEARELMKVVNHKLGNEHIKFYPGIDYRHLLVLKGEEFSTDIACTPPHDALDEPIAKVLVRAKNKEAEKTANLLNKMILTSQSILEEHPVNLKRAKKGKDKANMIWPWSAGKKPLMETFQERFAIRGAVIAAVDLIKGIGIYAGFDVINVKGATGLYNTNYEGKADACLKALKSYELVWVHVEASDEAAHEGNLELKIKTIEYFDKRLVGRVLDGIGEDIHIALLPDHFTPVSMRTHAADAVPFLMYDPQKDADEVSQFDEFSCAKGSLGLLEGDKFIRMFLGKDENIHQ